MQAEGEMERRLAAILAADVAGYSRLVGKDDRAAFARLTDLRRIAAEEIAARRGAVVDTAGDSLLAQFVSVTDAVTCAVALQARLGAANELLPAEVRMELRIGVHLGDVLVHGREVLGDGVNIAARLQAEARPGGICLSASAREHLPPALDLAFEDLGELSLKNIARPVRAYRLGAGAPSDKAAARPLPLPDRPSIAVLPFANMSGDAEQDYFADGITEEIITALSRIRWFFVIARNSSFTYKGRAVDIRQVGRELGVRYVLEGSVRKARNRLRITGQLIEAENGRHIWAEKYDGALDDVFELQDRVTVQVAAAIEPSLQLSEMRRSALKPTDNLEAYDNYLLGLSRLYLGTNRDLAIAQELMLEAVAKDPSFALAKAGAARAITNRHVAGLSPPADVRRAIELAEEAIREGHDDPVALSTAGQALAHLTGDPALGLRAVQQAMRINPNSAHVLYCSGAVHYFAGEDETAIEQLRESIRLSPLDPQMPQILAILAWALLAAGDIDAAIAHGERAIALNADYPAAYRVTCAAMALSGRMEEARRHARKLLELTPAFRLSTFPFPRRLETVHAGISDALREAGIPD